MTDVFLNRLANVLMIVTCVVLLAFVSVRSVRRPSTAARVAYNVGDTLPEIEGLHFTDNSHTLLVFFSSHCTYCVQDATEIAEAVSSAKSAGVPALGLTTYSVETEIEFASSHKLGFSSVLRYSPEKLKVRATPVVMVADRRGKVVEVVIGKLTSADLDKLRAVLAAKS